MSFLTMARFNIGQSSPKLKLKEHISGKIETHKIDITYTHANVVGKNDWLLVSLQKLPNYLCHTLSLQELHQTKKWSIAAISGLKLPLPHLPALLEFKRICGLTGDDLFPTHNLPLSLSCGHLQPRKFNHNVF